MARTMRWHDGNTAPVKPLLPKTDIRTLTFTKTMATHSGSTRFTNTFDSPFPVARPLEESFANLDDDFEAHAALPQQPRSAPSAACGDNIQRSVTHVKSAAETPIIRLSPDTRDEAARTNAQDRGHVSQLPRTTIPAAPVLSDEFMPTPASQWPAEKPAPPQFRHPLVVWTLGDLMSHLGLGVIILLAAQAWASWEIGGFLNRYLEGGLSFYAAASLALMLTLNAFVWFRRRGRLFDQFVGPGAALFALAIVPALAIHVAGILKA